MRQQCEGIVGIEVGRTGQQGSLAFLGQQIVEVPLHRAASGAIALQPFDQWNAWAKRISIRVGQPLPGILERPQAVCFVKRADELVVYPGLERTRHQFASLRRVSSFFVSASCRALACSGISAVRRMPNWSST
ncbi:hypothetical protein UIB01_10050 [Stutzerimonas decontaminans]|uniref:Uncharacterized protein n=1 Tax=Stutzerimonas stutzeri TaxID=316 RepID=A0A023WYU5_STUST|nr:hypothetical protein UIB01_10050 [Stutzerimonas decontaminans]